MKREEPDFELKRENAQLREALRQCRALLERTGKLLHRANRLGGPGLTLDELQTRRPAERPADARIRNAAADVQSHRDPDRECLFAFDATALRRRVEHLDRQGPTAVQNDAAGDIHGFTVTPSYAVWFPPHLLHGAGNSKRG